jgi:hypothetical protein
MPGSDRAVDKLSPTRQGRPADQHAGEQYLRRVGGESQHNARLFGARCRTAASAEPAPSAATAFRRSGGRTSSPTAAPTSTAGGRLTHSGTT